MSDGVEHLKNGWVVRRYESYSFCAAWWLTKPAKNGQREDEGIPAIIVQFKRDLNRYYIRPLNPVRPTPMWHLFHGPDIDTSGPYDSLETAQVMYVLLYGN